MEAVSFTRMDQGTEAEYAFLTQEAKDHKEQTLCDNVLGLLKMMQGPKLGYQIDRYQHSLQTATRAERDGADEETIVCALLHDIGDVVAPDNHSELAAAVLRPYVSDKNYWILKHHGVFQGYYYFDKVGLDRDARDRFRDSPYYEDCVRFCECWDQTSFDPDYDTLPLEHFEPMVRRVMGGEPTAFSV